MNIMIKKKDGTIMVNSKEIVIMVEEQLKMVPGIKTIGPITFKDKVRTLLHTQSLSGAKVYEITQGVIGIEARIICESNSNFTEIARHAQEILVYSISKHYGVEVRLVDIYVEGVNKQ